MERNTGNLTKELMTAIASLVERHNLLKRPDDGQYGQDIVIGRLLDRISEMLEEEA